MTTLDLQVAASSDDAWENTVQAMFLTVAEPNIDHVDEWHGWRFTNVTIPKGATIDVAYCTLDLPSSAGDEPLCEFSADDVDDAPTFTSTAGNISDRANTTARVTWDDSQLGAPGTFNTPSLVSIVQEIVDRGSWASGNALAILSNGNTSLRDLLVTNYDGTASLAPKLHIEYSVPQFARADSTVSNAGSWLDIGAPTLHEAIDEVSPNDSTDYNTVLSSNNDEKEFIVGTSDVTDPFTDSGHILRFRIRHETTTGETKVVLQQGTTTIVDSGFKTTALSTWTSYTVTLSATEADSITDYTDLRFQVIYRKPGGGSSAGRITWIELEVPEAVTEQTKTYTSDVRLLKEKSKAYTSDVLLQKEKSKAFTIDALLQKQKSEAYSADAFLQVLDRSRAYTADALLQAGEEKTYALDARLVDTGQLGYSTDLRLAHVFNVFLSDGVFSDWESARWDTDDYRWDQPEGPAKDSVIWARFQDDSMALSDAIGQVVEFLKLYAVDALLQAANREAAYALDALLREGDIQRAYTIDAFLQELNRAQAYTAGALLQREKALSYTADALLKALGVGKTYSTDAFLRALKQKTYSADAFLQVLDRSRAYTADALLQRQKSLQYSLDSLLREQQSLTYILDLLLRGEKSATYETDLILAELAAALYSVDVLLQQGKSLGYTADARLVLRRQLAYTLDTLLKATGTAQPYTLDMLLAAPGQVGYTVDLRLGFAFEAFLTDNVFSNWESAVWDATSFWGAEGPSTDTSIQLAQLADSMGLTDAVLQELQLVIERLLEDGMSLSDALVQAFIQFAFLSDEVFTRWDSQTAEWDRQDQSTRWGGEGAGRGASEFLRKLDESQTIVDAIDTEKIISELLSDSVAVSDSFEAFLGAPAPAGSIVRLRVDGTSQLVDLFPVQIAPSGGGRYTQIKIAAGGEIPQFSGEKKGDIAVEAVFIGTEAERVALMADLDDLVGKPLKVEFLLHKQYKEGAKARLVTFSSRLIKDGVHRIDLQLKRRR